MMMRSAEVPMWRKIKGKTPCPMLPKPTNTILPAKFTCTSFLLIILFSFWFALFLYSFLMVTPGGRTPPAYLAGLELLKFLQIRGLARLRRGARRSAAYQDKVNFGGTRTRQRVKIS